MLAAAAFALTVVGALAFAGVLVVCGLAYWAWHETTERMTTGAAAVTPAPLLVAAAVAGAVSASLLAEIFLEGLKAGLLTFGGAYTVVPFLHDTAVQGQGWLTESQFLDGLALGGVLPAPLIIFSTFVGYIAGGLSGSIAITVGIFLPAFIFPIFFHRFLVAVAEDARIRPFLLGVAVMRVVEAEVALVQQRSGGVGTGLDRTADRRPHSACCAGTPLGRPRADTLAERGPEAFGEPPIRRRLRSVALVCARPCASKPFQPLRLATASWMHCLNAARCS